MAAVPRNAAPTRSLPQLVTLYTLMSRPASSGVPQMSGVRAACSSYRPPHELADGAITNVGGSARIKANPRCPPLPTQPTQAPPVHRYAPWRTCRLGPVLPHPRKSDAAFGHLTAGNRTRSMVRPGTDWTFTSPPWLITTRRTRSRPLPVPSPTGLTVESGSNTRHTKSVGRSGACYSRNVILRSRRACAITVSVSARP